MKKKKKKEGGKKRGKESMDANGEAHTLAILSLGSLTAAITAVGNSLFLNLADFANKNLSAMIHQQLNPNIS